MEWISVKDDLPAHKSPFIGTDGEIIFAAYWCEDIDCYKVGGWESCYYCGGASPVAFEKKFIDLKIVTHWMPLMKLPIDSNFRPPSSLAQVKKARYEENLMQSKRIERDEV